MDRIQHKPGVLHKAGESLYRYSSNRVYYARVKVDGKEIKRSLRTTDPALARRNLAALREATKSSARLTNRHRGEKLFAGVGVHLAKRTHIAATESVSLCARMKVDCVC